MQGAGRRSARGSPPPVLDAVPVYAPAAQGLSVRDLWTALIHRPLFLLFLTLSGLLLGVTAAVLVPPTWRAEGLLVIDTQELDIQGLSTIRSARTVEPWGGRSEARILTSRELVEKAILDLGLQFDEHFNATLGRSLLRTIGETAWLPKMVRDVALRLSSEPVVDEAVLPDIVEDVQKRLQAFSEERSYAINLVYEGREPTSAAALVNKLMELYIGQEIGAKRAANEQASVQLRQRVAELQANYDETLAEIRAREAETGLLQAGDRSFRAEELAAIAAERREVESRRQAVLRDLEQIDTARREGRTSLLSADLATPRLRGLWDVEAELQRQLAESRADLGPRHPRMLSLQDELTDTVAAIDQELDSIRAGVARQAALLNDRERVLDQRLGTAEQAAATTALGRSELDQMRDQAASQQALLELYRERYEQTIANLDLFAADARIVSRAAPPHKPSSPGTAMMAAVGAMIGLLGGVGWIAMREWLHDGVGTPEQAADVTGLMPLGGIPRVRTLFGGDAKLGERVVHQPGSVLSETLRGVLFRIQMSRIDGKRPKVVMVTSPMPKDGKSSLVVALARTASREGLRCLAIDCDFRRPKLATSIGVRPSLRLNDYIDGLVEIEDVVTRDPRSRVHFLLSRQTDNCTKSFLEQKRLVQLLDAARQHYDLILIDTPPVMKVIDPLVLSALADAVILVVSWREVSRKVIRETIRRLEATQCTLLGFVLSRVGGDVPAAYVYGGYEADEG